MGNLASVFNLSLLDHPGFEVERRVKSKTKLADIALHAPGCTDDCSVSCPNLVQFGLLVFEKLELIGGPRKTS